MLEKILQFILNQRGLIIFFSLVIAVLGIYSYINLPIDAFPDVTNNQVEIISHADGLSALEIERDVTYPIEMAMRGLPDVEQLRSVTKFGLSIVTIIFKDNVDIYFARQLVFERLAEAGEKVPSGVEITLGPIATAMGEIYQYTIDGKFPTDSAGRLKYLTDLRTLQEWIIAPLLKSVPGVNEINSFGGYFKQYQVEISPEKLVKFEVSANDVFAAVQNNNQNVGGNILEKNSDQYIVRGVGLLENLDDIRDIVLKSSDGTPVLLGDVAEVRIGEAVRMGAAIINGEQEAVGGIVMMLKGENSREVVEAVKQKVEEINTGNVLPEGLKIVPYYDRSEIVNASVNTVNKALLEGAILVLLILYLLLRSFRGSVIVLIALPLTLCATFIVMKVFGLSANLMSLGGLAISIGIIIDAAIIQVENVQRHLSESKGDSGKISIVLKGVLEVRKPSILGEIIIATTFVPILTLEGIEGKMFAPLALTIGAAIICSLLISIFIIPVLCSIFLKVQPEKESFVMKYAQSFYLKVFHVSQKQKPAILGVAFLLLVAALFTITRLGTEFIPIMDEGAFDADIALLPGVSLEKAMEINKLASKKLKEFPELGIIVSKTGQTGTALDTRGVDKTGFVGVLKPRSEWRENISREELFGRMRESLETIPGIGFGFSQPIQCRIDELVAGTKSQLIIKLFGNDLDTLKIKAGEIVKILSAVEGAEDIMAEKTSGQPYLTIKIDRGKIARYGMNISDVQNIIEIAIAGKPATLFFEENRSFDIVVRLPEQYRNSVEAIGNIMVPTKTENRLPLEQLADIEIVEGPVQISRQDGIRRIGIELNISGRDIGGFVAEVKEKLKAGVDLPSGYYLSWGGQFENQQRAIKKLAIIGPLAIGLIFLLLFVTFRSLRRVLLVMSNLPFALIGGVFSLYISGQFLSVPASVGFIVLFGVAVLNGVVLVSYISDLKENGMKLEEAILTGSMSRLRPVLMTASIAITSLIPMLFATGAGSEIQKPLATVVIGGLITSTVLTLIMIPAFYPWFEKKESNQVIS